LQRARAACHADCAVQRSSFEGDVFSRLDGSVGHAERIGINDDIPIIRRAADGVIAAAAGGENARCAARAVAGEGDVARAGGEYLRRQRTVPCQLDAITLQTFATAAGNRNITVTAGFNRSTELAAQPYAGAERRSAAAVTGNDNIGVSRRNRCVIDRYAFILVHAAGGGAMAGDRDIANRACTRRSNGGTYHYARAAEAAGGAGAGNGDRAANGRDSARNAGSDTYTTAIASSAEAVDGDVAAGSLNPVP